MVEKVKRCEIGEQILWAAFFLKQVHSIFRNSWCNPLVHLFGCSYLSRKYYFQNYCLVHELYIYNLLFLPSYENNLKASYQNPKELVWEPILFASCLPFACEPLYLTNLKNVLVTVVWILPSKSYVLSCCTSELKFPCSLPSFTLCFSRPKMSKYQADGITFGTLVW
jgi:hypothetical protein